MTSGPNTSDRRYVLSAHSFPAPTVESALYIVSTPIGNLGDITIRALETLAGADVIACEDTRVTGVLVQRFGLRTPLMPYHEHNAEKQRPKILEKLENGQSIALVSDAGTPLISDPGYRLVRDVTEAGFRVIPIPGASALLAGLVGAGLPSDNVFFNGFLPHKTGAKTTRLTEVANMNATLVFYESPRRLGATLGLMCDVLGPDRDAVVARELTKKFETFERGRLADLANLFDDTPPKGEIVIMVGPPKPAPAATAQDAEALLRQALESLPVSAAAKQVAKQTGLDRNTLYKQALDLKNE